MKGPRGGDGQSSHAHHRSTGAGHRSERPHHARPPPARARVCRRGGEGTSGQSRGDGGTAGCGLASRHRQAGGARAHHFQAGQADAGRIRKDEDPPGGVCRDSGARPLPLPRGAIVRAHHEKYDGSGYPFGLKGEEIPIGARILSAVDFLDALASDRQYRRAMALEEVMERLKLESGRSFDPRVVNVLMQRYKDLEKLIEKRPEAVQWSRLSTDVKVERGEAPAAGFVTTGLKDNKEATFLASIAAARQEAQALFELSQDLGASLSLDETLSVFSVKLKRLVPYDSIAIYVLRGSLLVPEHVSGDNFRLFASLKIPMGQGLSGWVAQNRKPIINGNPSVEPGYLNDPTKFSTLRSALALP